MVRLLLIALSIVALDLVALFILYKTLRFAFLQESALTIAGRVLFQISHGLITPFAFLAAVYVLKNLITYFLFKKQIELSQSVSKQFIDDKFSEELNKEVASMEERHSLDVVNELSQMTSHFNDRVLLPSVLIIAETTLIVLVASAAAFVNSKVLLALVLIAAPVTLFLIWWSRRDLERIGLNINTLYPALYRDISTTVLANPEISIWNNRAWIHGRFMKKVGSMFKLRKKSYLISGVLSPRILEVSIVLSLLLIAVTLMGSDQEEFLSILTLFAAIAFRLLPSVNRIVNSQNSIRSYAFLLSIRPTGSHETTNQPGGNEVIESMVLNDVTIERTNKIILESVNLRLHKGSCIGISGPSGSGKSTLAFAIAGLMKPGSGEILINGSSNSTWTDRVSIVRQSPYFLHGSIADNISFGLDNDSSKMRKVLNICRLNELVDSFPEGVETLLGEGGKTVSGGEAQRIAIARAVYKPADLLIFDESFSDLNESLRMAILDSIRDEFKDLITLIISHDQDLLKRCDKIYTLENGTISETNT